MIWLDKFNGSFNTTDDLSMKICVPMTYLQKYVFPVKQKTNVKVFNVITRINEAKTFVKHISCNCKCKFNSTTCNSNQK